jgi:hypothetical protein
MTDINAFREVFGFHVIHYLCLFHAAQAWERNSKLKKASLQAASSYRDWYLAEVVVVST